MRKRCYCYLIVFLTLLLIPLVKTNTEHNVKSELDNRKLVEFPEMDDTGYEKSIEKYLQDRIGFRDTMVTGYQLVNNITSGELTRTYTFGQDGYAFFHMHNNILYGDYHKKFAEAVRTMQEYCESRGAKFYFLFNPEKISVYRRFLPVGVNYNDGWVDEMLEYMEELGVHYVSNKDLLTALSYDERVYNWKYDAGHWNDLGAFYGTNNLLKRIGEDFPAVKEYSLDEWDVSTTTSLYYTNSRFPVKEEVPVFTLKTGWRNETERFADIKLNEKYRSFRYYVNEAENADQYPKLLVFQGSYYNSRSTFFVGRSSEYIGVHDYQNVFNLDYYFNIFQPDVVVFEAAEYTFNDEYFDSGIMENLQYNPAIDDVALPTEIDVDDTIKLSIIQGDGFDSVYLDKGTITAKYVYLVSDGHVYDMQLRSQGLYSTGIPHDAITDEAALIFEDYEGETYRAELDIQKAVRFTGDYSYTDGASYDSKEKQYVFSTDLNGNRFNAVNIQLIDAVSGQFIVQIDSKKTAGDCEGNFIHTTESGWYIIRMKANANKKDEGIDILAYLHTGQKYFYSFRVDKLNWKRIVVDHIELYGMCPWDFSSQELLINPQLSAGTETDEDGRNRLTTNIDGNCFSSVILQLRSCEDDTFIDPIAVKDKTGAYSGYYMHDSSTGAYWLKLRANSNKKDECIEVKVYLQEGMLYKHAFTIDRLTPTEVIIAEPSFVQLAQ